MRGALDGVRVVGFTHYAAGPYCLSMLGDHGADVINVESPDGDQFRSRDGLYGEEFSGYFIGLNRSKRSVSLDLAEPAGLAAARRLVATADVVVQNYRVGVMNRLGLGYDGLSEAIPRLVYCSISAWGESGPMSELPGMDVLAQARGGFMGVTGDDRSGPMKVGVPVADYMAAYLASFGIMLALRERERSGRGQRLTVNLLDSMIASTANLIPFWDRTGEPSKPLGNGHPQLAPYGTFRTADSRIVIAAPGDKFWQALCVALDLGHLIADERYKTPRDRVLNTETLTNDLEAVLVCESSRHWLQRLQHATVPCAPVNTLGEALTQPQVTHNNMVISTDHPRVGATKIPGVPVALSRTPGNVSLPAPSLGEHTSEVLLEIGYSLAEADAIMRRAKG